MCLKFLKGPLFLVLTYALLDSPSDLLIRLLLRKFDIGAEEDEDDDDDDDEEELEDEEDKEEEACAGKLS